MKIHNLVNRRLLKDLIGESVKFARKVSMINLKNVMAILINYRMQLIVSALIVISGFLIFELRGVSGVTGLTAMTYDSVQYIRLIEGGGSEPPFSTRILLIYICKILPFSAEVALLVVNAISMWLVLLCVFSLLEFLCFSVNIAILAVASSCSSFVFVYYFNNPYLTDLPAMAALIFFLAALIRREFKLALISCCVSLLFRESIAALIPMFFLFFNFRKSVFASVLAAFAYMAPKLFIAGNVSVLDFDRQIDFLYFIKFFMSYGMLWLASSLGYFTLCNRMTVSIKFEVSLLVLSFAGSVLSSLHAADVTRMYLLMFPSIVIGSAYLFKYAAAIGKGDLSVAFVLSNIFLSFLLMPNHLISSGGLASLDSYIKSNSVWILFFFVFQVFILYKIILSNNSIALDRKKL